MIVLIYFLLSIIVYAYLGYPITVMMISAFKHNKVDYSEEFTPTVSMLIAAYNEESFIEKKILNSLELDYPQNKFEIVVVSDGSTDETDAIVRKYTDRGIKLLRVEGRVGKTEARNQAVLKCANEIIVFSDATAIYEKDAIKKLVRNFADKTVGMVSGNLKYSDQSAGSMGLATKIYWKYESAIKNAQSKMRTLTGAIGCINAFRRELYYVLPSNIIEDFTEPLMIVAQNYRIIYEKEAIASERTTQKPSQEFHMRVRVIRGGMKGFLYAFRKMNFKDHGFVILQLIGHKVLRWLVPVFLILLFITSTLGVLLVSNVEIQLLFLAQIICYTFAILGIFIQIPGAVGKVLSIPTYFLIVNSASLKALYLTLTTELEATWETNTY